MKYIRRAEQRGRANFGWLDSKHSFSFGHYVDPNHMGVSVLRVINDDTVMPGRGFDTHGHRDMEIISYVIEGALKHKDSTGNHYIVPAGDVQRMSAGSGVMHSEFNASNTEHVKFLQIWIQPEKTGIKPSYQQKTLPQQGQLTPLVTPDGANDSLTINQDASLSRLMLNKDESYTLSTNDRQGYLHIIKGELMTDDMIFQSGDAFAIEPKKMQKIQATQAIEALWFDLPITHKPS